MASRFRTPGGERTTNAILTLVWGGILCFVGLRFWLNPKLGVAGWFLLVLGLPLIAAGVLLWFRRGWARWPAVAIFGFLVAGQAWGWALKGFDFWRTFLLVALAWTAVDVFRHFSPQALAAAKSAEALSGLKGRPVISLALLLRRPRFLDAQGLARYCESAWGGSYRVLARGQAGPTGPPEEASRWVGGRSPLFLVWSPEGMFLVHNHDSPYFDKTDPLASDSPNELGRTVCEENRGWLAVDVMISPEKATPREALYPVLGQLIAALAGPDFQAIYDPETKQLYPWDDSLEEKLLGPEAAVFFQPERRPDSEVPTTISGGTLS